MSIEGRIAVDVGFTDSASSDGVQAVKRLALTSTDSQTTGKVQLAEVVRAGAALRHAVLTRLRAVSHVSGWTNPS